MIGKNMQLNLNLESWIRLNLIACKSSKSSTRISTEFSYDLLHLIKVICFNNIYSLSITFSIKLLFRDSAASEAKLYNISCLIL